MSQTYPLTVAALAKLDAHLAEHGSVPGAMEDAVRIAFAEEHPLWRIRSQFAREKLYAFLAPEKERAYPLYRYDVTTTPFRPDPKDPENMLCEVIWELPRPLALPCLVFEGDKMDPAVGIWKKIRVDSLPPSSPNIPSRPVSEPHGMPESPVSDAALSDHPSKQRLLR